MEQLYRVLAEIHLQMEQIRRDEETILMLAERRLALVEQALQDLRCQPPSGTEELSELQANVVERQTLIQVIARARQTLSKSESSAP